jgi:hypothetical protein
MYYGNKRLYSKIKNMVEYTSVLAVAFQCSAAPTSGNNDLDLAPM